MKFEGEYINGEKTGKGKEYYFKSLIFEGEFLNGKRWNGKKYDLSRNIAYEIKNGMGFIKNHKFEGEYMNGELIYVKKYNWINDLQYECEYLNGKRNGKGKEYDYNGKLIFEGEYYNDHKFKGREYFKNGKLYYDVL